MRRNAVELHQLVNPSENKKFDAVVLAGLLFHNVDKQTLRFDSRRRLLTGLFPIARLTIPISTLEPIGQRGHLLPLPVWVKFSLFCRCLILSPR